jgi:hypothetical protein
MSSLMSQKFVKFYVKNSELGVEVLYSDILSYSGHYVLECRYYFIASFVIYIGPWAKVSNLFHHLTTYLVSF